MTSRQPPHDEHGPTDRGHLTVVSVDLANALADLRARIAENDTANRERLAVIETKQDLTLRTQEAVLTEARRTNGRITNLEQKEAARTVREALAAEQKDDRSGWKRTWVAPIVTGGIVALLAVELARLLG